MSDTAIEMTPDLIAAGRPDSVFSVNPQSLATAIQAEMIDVLAPA